MVNLYNKSRFIYVVQAYLVKSRLQKGPNPEVIEESEYSSVPETAHADHKNVTFFCFFPFFRSSETFFLSFFLFLYLFLAFLRRNAPTTPAATPTPLSMATPMSPSRATLSSMSERRFEA